MTLEAFLLERIAEDEAVALEMSGPEPGPTDPRPAAVRLINRLAPKMLAECEAKRRIVAALTTSHDAYGIGQGTAEHLLSLLALPYAEHADFRSEWMGEGTE
jgi:Family of unknown function (DUF6221)